MKRFAKFCALLMVLTVVFSMALTVYADSNVTYYTVANEFVFAPENLFDGLHNVMPGDSITEVIELKNGSTGSMNIKVYLRSLGAQEGTDDFLHQLDLTVKKKDSVLFEAPADKTAQLTNWVYLGTLKPQGKAELELTLDVPIELDDKYQNRVGYIDWEFKVEEIPETDSPQTGDTSNIIFYAGLLSISAAALFLLLLLKKRRKEED